MLHRQHRFKEAEYQFNRFFRNCFVGIRAWFLTNIRTCPQIVFQEYTNQYSWSGFFISECTVAKCDRQLTRGISDIPEGFESGTESNSSSSVDEVSLSELPLSTATLVGGVLDWRCTVQLFLRQPLQLPLLENSR